MSKKRSSEILADEKRKFRNFLKLSWGGGANFIARPRAQSCLATPLTLRFCVCGL